MRSISRIFNDVFEKIYWIIFLELKGETMRRFTCISVCVAVLLSGAALYAQEAADAEEDPAAAEAVEPTAEAPAGERCWTNLVSATVSAPIFILNRSASGKATACGIYGNMSYTGTGSNGFTLKADLGSGLLLSKSFQPKYLPETPVCRGWGASARIGAGYTFVNTPRLQFAVLGTVNLDYMLFTHTQKIVSYAKEGTSTVSHSTDQEQDENMLVCDFGLEGFVTFRLTDRMGIFADVNVSFPGYGTEWVNGTYMDASYSWKETVQGYAVIVPSAGVSLYF
jgi:hypothetical protein